MSTIELVDASKLAERFNVTVPTVNTWVREGRVPYIRVSRKTVRFVLTDVQAALSHEPSEERAEHAATVAAESRQPEGENP